MASTIYPKNKGMDGFPDYEQTKKLVNLKGNTKTRNHGGAIIAKGNIIEGIEAKE